MTIPSLASIRALVFIPSLAILTLAGAAKSAQAAQCEPFLDLIEEGRLDEVETALLESRTDKACAHHLVLEHLRNGDVEEAVEWINFARNFTSRERDPELYPQIFYYMLLLDPEPHRGKRDFLIPSGYSAEQDYNELLGFGGGQIERLSSESLIVLLPEMRAYLQDPRDEPCPDESEWATRLDLEWDLAEEICARVESFERAVEVYRNRDAAERDLGQLAELGVDTDAMRRAYAGVEPEPVETDVATNGPSEPKTGVPEQEARSPEPELSLPDPQDVADSDDPDEREAADGASSSREKAIDLLTFVEVPNRVYRIGCTTNDNLCHAIESPVTRVRISKPFRLAAYETTNAAYRLCVEDGACERPEKSPHFDDPAMADHPVVFVNWEESQAFCKWLGGRLPTEAKWELAARGKLVGARYPNGHEITRGEANFKGRRGKDRWTGSSPVGSFPPNTRGLYDMAGNVREWVADVYGYYPGGTVTDPVGKSYGRLKIARGGDFSQEERDLRVSARHLAGPAARVATLGFRCLLPALEP